MPHDYFHFSHAQHVRPECCSDRGLVSTTLHTLYVLHCEVEIAAVTYLYLISSSGLESYPQLELAKKQMTGFGGMVTFFIKGDVDNSKQFFKASKVRFCLVLSVYALLFEAETRLVFATRIFTLSLTLD